jgi:hypothetical protein
MASAYPTALDSLATTRTNTDAADTTHPADHNNANDAINKIEAELGTLAKGPYAASVRERFEGSAYKGQSCRCATTAALPAGTYANGTLGVGATFTATATGAWAAIDGVTLALGDRLLVKNQAAGAQNGIYTVTTLGAAGVAMVLTRAIDADTSAKAADMKVLVDTGTLNADTEWLCSATAPTMGTTVLPFRRSQPIYGHGNPRFPWDPGALTTQVVMTTVPRVMITASYTVVLTTATQYLIGGLVVPAGRTITNINFVALTAGAAPTISWFALARQSDRVTMAHTANIVTAPTANAITTRALTATWTPNEDTPVWVVMSYQVATTAMALAAAPTGSATINLLTPAMAATNGVAPTTTVPTDGTTVITGATAGISNVPLFWLT